MYFPTGKDVPSCNATPNNDPAQQMANSGASSAKYFNDVKARGTSCTSSKMTNVLFGLMRCPEYTDSCSMMRWGDNVPSNIALSTSFCSKFT